MLGADTAPPLAPAPAGHAPRARTTRTRRARCSAAAALRAVATNEPAARRRGARPARLRGGADGRCPQPTELPWFAQASAALVWADAFDEAAAALDAGVAESRATGDCALFATSMAWRAWLLLRRGDLQGAAGDARAVLDAADLPAPRLYRPIARRCSSTTLIEQGDLDAAEAALEPSRRAADAHADRRVSCCSRAGACAWRSASSTPALADLQAAGDVALRTGAVSPAFLLWRSEAALAQLALGEPEAARRWPARSSSSAASRARRARSASRCARPAS